MTGSFEATYPTIAEWVDAHGFIEIGSDGFSASLIRALDEDGLVWEGEERYESLGAALRELEAALDAWMREQGLRGLRG